VDASSHRDHFAFDRQGLYHREADERVLFLRRTGAYDGTSLNPEPSIRHLIDIADKLYLGLSDNDKDKDKDKELPTSNASGTSQFDTVYSIKVLAFTRPQSLRRLLGNL
jgi:hypothetical protein